jgi:hypothetical protein
MIDLRKVQTCREISEEDVIVINFIIKNRARRYIAAPVKEWLYPEKQTRKRLWSKLGSKYFLMPDPRKISFTTGIFTGNDNGPTWAQDEYGRIPNDKDPNIKKKRDKEFKTFHAFQHNWDRLYGPLTKEELSKYW